MKQGFLAFVLSAVFLLAITAAAAGISHATQDSSYQKYQLANLDELAIKSAFYQSEEAAARAAYVAALAAKTSPRDAVEAAAYANALLFEHELRAQGMDVSFWCGDADEQARRAASLQMQEEKKAVAPGAVLPLASAACKEPFQADVLRMRLHLSGIGFSSYSDETELGYATVLPSGYEVDFGVTETKSESSNVP